MDLEDIQLQMTEHCYGTMMEVGEEEEEEEDGREDEEEYNEHILAIFKPIWEKAQVCEPHLSFKIYTTV